MAKSPRKKPVSKSIESRDSSGQSSSNWWDFLDDMARESTAGERVTAKTSFNCETYFACVRNIAEDVGRLPLITYYKDGTSRERAEDSPWWYMLRSETNAEMTSGVFRETLTAHALGYGNGYAEIIRNGAGQVVEMWPISPERVTPKRKPSGELYYDVRNPNGQSTPLEPMDVLHIHGVGFDGVQGYSVARCAMETIGSALAMTKFAGAFFGNGALPGVVLQHPGRIGNDAAQNIRRSWERKFKGSSNAHKVAVLEEGMTLNKFTIAPDEAQFIESKYATVESICRWFRMPPHKVQHLLRATFSNIEHQALEYLNDTLHPWLVRWENEINRKVFGRDNQQFYAEHLVDSNLRVDTKTRYEAHQLAINSGWKSINEVRAIENLNPVDPEIGDQYFMQSAMTTLDKIVEDEPPVVPPAESTGGPTPMPAEHPDDPEDQQRSTLVKVIETELARMVRKESKAAIAAARKPDAFIDWIESFYERHSKTLTDAISPAIEAWNAATDGESIVVGDFVSEYVRHSQDELLSVAGQVTPDRLPERVSQMAENWIKSRAADFAWLATREMEHAS